MEDVLNATLAGGVIIGASADLITAPVGAIIVGIIGGIVSTIGFRKLKPILQDRIALNDTCGVHNLHGLPGVLGGIFSSIVVASITPANFGGE